MAATIKDIANRTGLGLATISSYLNGGNVREKNRIKIEEAINELHFEVNEVARGLKTNKTKTVGVVIPELQNLFHTEIIANMEDILRNHGYATIVCDCRNDKQLEKNAVDFLYKKRVDGIINIPVSSDGQHLMQFMEKEKPVVLIDRKISAIHCDSILVNNVKAAKDAVDILLLNGHTRIGMIGGPEDIFTAQERMLGYNYSLLEAGITPDRNLIVHGDYTIKSGVKCIKALIKNNPDITAVFVANYEMTMGAVIGLNELGVAIADQISLIGYDNIEFARAIKPSLTIVTQPTVKIAEQAANCMLRRLDGNEDEFEVIKLDSAIIEGHSVRRI